MRSRNNADILVTIFAAALIIALVEKIRKNKDSIKLDELTDDQLNELKNKLEQMGDTEGVSLVQEVLKKRGVKRIGPSQNGTY